MDGGNAVDNVVIEKCKFSVVIPKVLKIVVMGKFMSSMVT